MTIERAITITAPLDIAGFRDALIAAGIPVETITSTFSANSQITVRYADSSTEQQRGADTDTALAAFIAAKQAAATAAANRAAADANVLLSWLTQVNGSTASGIQKILFDALINFGDGYRTASDVTQVTQLRPIINSTLTILDALPTPIKTSFTKKATALGLPANAVGASLVVCQQYQSFLEAWMGAALATIVAARMSGAPD